jgi:peptidoglycan/LPS O-acetylase OafA/YrhL
MSKNIFFTFVLAGNISMECFLCLSAFVSTYKLMQIYDANNGLTIIEILKFYLRKYLRYAPIFYFVFFAGWALVSRLEDGPMYFVNNRLY